MTNCWRVFFIFSFLSSVSIEADSVCSVQPTATVVVVGESVSLNCTSTGDISIDNWQIGTNVETKTKIYIAQLFGPRNGTIQRYRYVAEGYSVTNETENKVSLYINKITYSQAGLYVCQCDDQKRSEATSVVVVLASEPKFSNISNLNNGKQVSFSCNISFNGSADVSSNLTIKDVFGNIVNNTLCSRNNAPALCNLQYTATANASVEQSYTCTVRLIANNSLIYSSIVNTSLEWRRVSRAEIVVSNPEKCSAEECVVRETITCKTDGEPEITTCKWWKNLNNGSNSGMIVYGCQYALKEIGKFMYKCQALNNIRGVVTSATSKTFTINVKDSDVYQVPALPITIALACVIIAILTTTIICLYRKLQQKSTSEALQISTEDVPVHYEALDTQKSSEERHREAYTAIQLPIRSEPGLPSDYMNSDFRSEYETIN